MDIEFLSTTFTKGWEDCQLRAWKDHETRVEEGDGEHGANPLQFGTIVHAVAEDYHRAILEGVPPPDPEELFDQHWSRASIADYEYFDFGRSEVGPFLERTLFHRQGETVATELFFVLDARTGKAHAFPDSDPSRDEMREYCRAIVAKGGVPVVSHIDRIDLVQSEDDQSLWAEVYDYKTNMQPFTRDEVDQSLQLGIYDLAVLDLWPEVDLVHCCFDMLRHGRFWTTFSDVDRLMLRAYLCATWDQIRNTPEPIPSINSYCSSCQYRLTCPEYQAVVKNPENLVQPAQDRGEDEEMEEFVSRQFEEYERLKSAIKILDNRANELSGVLNVAIMEENNGKPLPMVDGREIYLKANPRYEYPIDDVFDILQEEGSLSMLKQCASISRPTLNKLLRGRNTLQERILPLEKTTFVRPTLTARKPK